MTARRRGTALMVGCAAAWAGGVVASEHALDVTGASASSLLVVQMAASVAVLGVAVAVTRTPTRGAWRHGWLGLLEPGLPYLLALAGLALTSAASASVLGSLEPALVPAVAWLLLRERPTAPFLGVVAGATAGAALVSLAPSTDGRSLAGDLLVVAGVVAAAAYGVLASRRVHEAGPLGTALAHQACALGFVAVAAVAGVLVADAGGLPTGASGLAWAAGSGVLGYALPFWLYLSAVTRISAARAAAHLTLIPVFGVALSVALLGEAVTAAQVAGSVLVVASLALCARLDARRPEPPAAPTTPIEPVVRVSGS
ncbi:MAG TPA: DMT family transporter [Iamia sp.]|nr:DMT family transporter [Iamia sp.]